MSQDPQHHPAPGERPDQIEQPTEPLDVDGVSAMTYGTAAWVIALLVLLLIGVRPSDPNGWWLWVCALGAGIGLALMGYTRRRAAVYRRHARAQQSG